MKGAVLVIVLSLTGTLAQAGEMDRTTVIAAKSGAIQQNYGRPSTGTYQQLSSIKSIFVAPFGNADVSEEIRQKTINRLVKAGFDVQDSPQEADAVLTGVATIKVSENVNGYMDVNKGNGFGTINGSTTFTPSFAVRLIGRNGQMLWSDESRFRLIHSPSPTSNAADQIVKDLVKAITKGSR